MSAHDIGCSVDEWQACMTALRRRVAAMVRQMPQAVDLMAEQPIFAGELANAIADLEAMQRLSEGQPLQRVELVDKATD